MERRNGGRFELRGRRVRGLAGGDGGRRRRGRGARPGHVAPARSHLLDGHLLRGVGVVLVVGRAVRLAVGDAGGRVAAPPLAAPGRGRRLDLLLVLVVVQRREQVERVADVRRDDHLDLVLVPRRRRQRRRARSDRVHGAVHVFVAQTVQIERVRNVAAEQELGRRDERALPRPAVGEEELGRRGEGLSAFARRSEVALLVLLMLLVEGPPRLLAHGPVLDRRLLLAVAVLAIRLELLRLRRLGDGGQRGQRGRKRGCKRHRRGLGRRGLRAGFRVSLHV